MNVRSLFIWLTSLSLVLTIGTPSLVTANFTDVSEDHPYAEAIEYVQENNIVNGYPDGTFQPDKTINRAEFTKIIVEAIYPDKANGDNCFSDVTDLWFARYVCFAKVLQIIGGYQDGSFKPNQNITFSEAAKIIINAFDYETSESEVWYRPFMDKLAEENAIPLSIDNHSKAITRGEMAEMIYRLKENITDRPTHSFHSITADILGTEWILDQVQDSEGKRENVEGATVPTIMLTGTQINGSDGCNQFTGTVNFEENRAFTVDDSIASTKMSCQNDVLVTITPEEFLSALFMATSYQKRGDRLQISFGDEGELLVFSDSDDRVITDDSACDLKPDAGECKSTVRKYYFDPIEGECKEFIWGGCDGTVPFSTQVECNQTCSGRASQVSQCDVAPVYGEGDSAFVKFFFNHEKDRCEGFHWSGKGGVIPFKELNECEELCEQNYLNPDRSCIGQGGSLIENDEGIEVCHLPSADAGAICTDSDQCEGYCVLNSTEAVVGVCYEQRPLIGCHLVKERGRTREVCGEV